MGEDGSNPEVDGDLSFCEFTIDEWDGLLTRPWISEVAPIQVFPGDTLTVRGSRSGAGDNVKIGAFELAPTVNSDGSISVTVPRTVDGPLCQYNLRHLPD